MTRPCSSSKEEQGPSLNGPSLSQREIDEGAFAEELPPLLLCDGDEICTVLSRARSPARLGRRVDAARASGRARSLLLYRTEDHAIHRCGLRFKKEMQGVTAAAASRKSRPGGEESRR